METHTLTIHTTQYCNDLCILPQDIDYPSLKMHLETKEDEETGLFHNTLTITSTNKDLILAQLYRLLVKATCLAIQGACIGADDTYFDYVPSLTEEIYQFLHLFHSSFNPTQQKTLDILLRALNETYALGPEELESFQVTEDQRDQVYYTWE